MDKYPGDIFGDYLYGKILAKLEKEEKENRDFMDIYHISVPDCSTIDGEKVSIVEVFCLANTHHIITMYPCYEMKISSQHNRENVPSFVKKKV